MKKNMKAEDRAAIYMSVNLTNKQALVVDELLLNEIARARKEAIKDLEEKKQEALK